MKNGYMGNPFPQSCSNKIMFQIRKKMLMSFVKTSLLFSPTGYHLVMKLHVRKTTPYWKEAHVEDPGHTGRTIMSFRWPRSTLGLPGRPGLLDWTAAPKPSSG